MSICLDTTTTQNSKYGAAFRKKPIMLKTHAEVSAFLEGKMHKNMVLREDNCTLSTNNSYRNHTTYEVAGSDSKKTFLDFGFLIRDETSCLKGTLDSEQDVDFYNFSIPFNRTIQNYFGVEIRMELPEGCDYNLTLYDRYGNQVGKAQWNGENQKTLQIPNWDTATSKYCIKIETAAGEPVRPNDSYKISFRVTDNPEAEKTDAIREAFGTMHNAYSQKDENWKKYQQQYNAILKETEKNYTQEVEKLHKQQFDSLPKEKQYTGNRTVAELLRGMAAGESLTDAEIEYVKIYANLKDIEKAQQQYELKEKTTKALTEDFNRLGIPPQELERLQIQIKSDGTVSVDGITDKTAQRQAEKRITEKYGDQLYRYYIGIAGSVGNLPANAYQYATSVQETERFLKKAAGKNVPLEDLYFNADGTIGGLPDNISNMINRTTNNAKIEEVRTMLQDIISKKRAYGDAGIPRFTAAFRFENDSLSVTDNGFTNDMGLLLEQMNSISSTDNMYAGIYHYQFQNVL